MSNQIWSKRTAPCTIFSTTTLSPRQIANKTYTLGCKKLEKDDKKSRQKYRLRERVLLYNMIGKAEEALSARATRTNRRVMAAEDENDSNEFSSKQNTHCNTPIQSRLREHQEEDQEQDQEDQEDIPTLTSMSTIVSTQVTVLPHLLPTDCNLMNKFILVV